MLDNISVDDEETIDDSNVHITEYTYDAFNQVILTTMYGDPTTSADDLTTAATYDTFGRRVSETNQLGLTRWFEYDAAGHLIAVILPAVPDPANSNTLTHPRYEYGYDALGNLAIIRDNVKHETVEGVPSEDHENDIDRTAARETVFTFDAQGRQLTRTLPIGVSTTGTADDFLETKVYDALGRLDHEVSFEGIVTQYVYDDTAGHGERLAAKRFFDTYTDYTDFLGNPGTYPPAQVTAYEYDALQRMTSVTQDAGGLAERIAVHAYDYEGRTAQVASPEGTIDYTYNDLGQLIETATAYTVTAYAYDSLGRLTGVTLNERFGEDLAYLSEEQITAYHFDLLGMLDRVASPNGVVADYEFDAHGRILSLTHFIDTDHDLILDTTGTPEIVVALFEYEVDAAGQRIGAVESFDPDTDGDFDLLHEFDWVYDNLNRLIEEAHDGTGTGSGDDYTTTYVFDLVGNRVEMITDSDDSDKDRTVAYTYDMNDRLLTEASDADTGDDTFTVYSYGNATGTSGGDATQQTGKKVWDGLDDTGSVIEAVTYDYNLQGRMAKATITKGGDTTELEYAYDDSGIRVGQTETVNSGTPVVHEYLVDANNPTGYQQVLEEFIDSVLAKSYTLGLDVIAQANTGSPVDDYFFLYDAHGSTRALLDAAAAVVQTYAYDAYGNALGFDTAAALTNLLYSGEQFDQKLAMQYLRARYYDAATGRFNRVDPFAGDPAVPHSLHKYLYGHANPLFHIDPTGHLSVVSILKVAAALIFLNHIHLQVVPRLSRIRYWLAPTVTRNNFSVLDYQMALLSREAYRLEPRNVHSWTVVGDPALSTLGLEPAAFFDNETGFSAVLYRHMIRHDYVLSFRGTEDGRDWDDNFMQALSGFAPQYDQAVSLAQKVHNEVTKRGGKLIFTGHSLGGGLATMAAYATGDRAITFNAAGVGLFGKTGALGHPPLSSPDIVAYFVQGEVLTEAQIVLGLFAPDTAGSLRRLYPALEDRDMSSLDLHGIDTVIRAMDGI